MGHLHGVDRATSRRLMFQAAKASALLSVLFLVVYSLTNWLTALRTDVGTWYFAWELAIPFVPLLIVPYMSIDLFFVAAPFLCRSEEELGVHARRVGFSTVLTYQHQVIDLVGGFLLAAFAFYLFREASPRLPVVRIPRVGTYYALAAAAVHALAPLVWPWGALLFWPATALGIVAGGYFGLGPGIFRKTEGRLPLSTRIVLAPILLGQWLSLLYYRRQCRAWDRVVPGVLIGRKLDKSEANEAVQQGVTAVLDLTGEFAEAAPLRATHYRNLPVLDLTAPTLDQRREAVAFISAELAGGTVYVHCKIGYSRSAAVVGAYLLASGQAVSAEEAIALLRRARPSIIVRAEVCRALAEFAAQCGRSADLVH